MEAAANGETGANVQNSAEDDSGGDRPLAVPTAETVCGRATQSSWGELNPAFLHLTHRGTATCGELGIPGHPLQTSMSVTVEDGTAGLGQTLRAGRPWPLRGSVDWLTT